jgi:predicted ATPase
VLDNCEHVIDEVARIVSAIMEANGRVRILATSRERLGSRHERVWPVEPLDPETARQLLLERARAAAPGFDVPPDSDALVAELVERIDRLPLAIEMAAARLPSLGLDDLVHLLRDRLDVLRSADRSADDRHRTIGALIGWSEDLLSEREREVLTGLSTFAGAAIAADIAAVAHADPIELTGGPLAGCVDQSLVVVDTMHQPTTYRLLETVRASAAHRQTDTHVARHANRIIEVASEMDRVLRTPDEAAAARRLDELVADVRVAHEWALGHDIERAGELTAALLHFAFQRQWTESVSWAQEVMASADAEDPASMAAAAACAVDASNRGDFDRARELAERSLAGTDRRVLISAHDTLANIGIYNGDFATARHHLAIMGAIGEADAYVQANTLVGETMVLAYGGDPGAALHHFAEHRPSTQICPSGEAWLAYTEADVLAALGRTDAALERFGDAVRLGSSVGSTFVRSVAELSALAARSRAGDPDEARAAFVPVLTHYRRVRSMTHAITALRNLVVLLVRAGDDEDAMVLLGAVSGPETKALYGAESEQLADARSTVEERAGDELVEEWVARGATHDPLWAVDHAISVLS